MKTFPTTISLFLTCSLFAQDRIPGQTFATRSEVIALFTSQPLATQAALDILKAGGNAIDAAHCSQCGFGIGRANRGL
jgi:gamma-glutamyltranspeptidase/glutathione hydrolase